MSDVNQFNCTCGVVTEPILKDAGNNKLCRFRAAVQDYKGEKQYFTIKSWGKTAEIMHEYLKVGRQIFISGRLTIETWTGKDGVEKTDPVITVDSFSFLSFNGQSKNNGEKTTKEGVGISIDSDEDIPF